jgi:hypothetical protein
MNTTEKTLSLHTVTITRKGKGVRNKTVEVETFAIPVMAKNAKAGDVPKGFDYAKTVNGLTISKMVDQVEQSGRLNQRLMCEAFARGLHTVMTTSSIRKRSEQVGIIRFILEQDLAMNYNAAKDLASVWQQQQDFQKRGYQLVSSIEDLAVGVRNYVDGQKALGKWITNTKDIETLITEGIEAEDTVEEEEEKEVE